MVWVWKYGTTIKFVDSTPTSTLTDTWIPNIYTTTNLWTVTVYATDKDGLITTTGATTWSAGYKASATITVTNVAPQLSGLITATSTNSFNETALANNVTLTAPTLVDPGNV